MQGDRGRRERCFDAVLCLVHQMRASVFLELVVVPSVDAMANPVIRAAGRAARSPIAGEVELRAARFRGRAVNACRAAVADVQVGVPAFRPGEPEVADHVAKGGTVERELPEHRGVVAAPVVDDVVPEIEHLRVLHQGGPRAEIRIQVVVERDVLRSTVSANMLAHEALTDDVPLEGGSIQVRAIPVQLRVGTPGNRAVIDDHIVHSGFGRSVEQDIVAGVVLHVAAHANAQVPKDNIVGAVDAPDAPVAVRLPGPFDLHAAG